MSKRQFFWLMAAVWIAYAVTIVSGAYYVWRNITGAAL